MPTPYKGRFRMECLLGHCPKHDIMTNVQPLCLVCENVKAEVIDLDDKTVFTISFNAAPKKDEETKPETVAEKGKKKR